VPLISTETDQIQLVMSFERLFALLRRLNPQQDISLTAVSTLRTLERCGPHRVSDLATAEGVTQPAMTQLVSRLERSGLAVRRTDPTDGRVVVVDLTEGGLDLLRQRREARAAKLLDLMAELTAEDRAAIMAALPAFDRLADGEGRLADRENRLADGEDRLAEREGRLADGETDGEPDRETDGGGDRS
jgi:DNA-binding MarR family transcriptional regulator